MLTGDRGLAGAFNGQVVRRALQVGAEHAGQGREVVYLPAGRKGLGTLRFRGRDVLTSWTGFSDRPEYGDAAAIAETISKAYVAAELDLVVLVYNRFVSALQQQVEAIELLPIPEGELAGLDARERSQEGEMLFEPDVEEMIGELLVSSLEVDGLSRPARVDRVRARRAHDRHAQRVRERRRPDQRLHAGDEPGPPGGDHAGDPRGRGRSGRPAVTERAGVVRRLTRARATSGVVRAYARYALSPMARTARESGRA